MLSRLAEARAHGEKDVLRLERDVVVMRERVDRAASSARSLQDCDVSDLVGTNPWLIQWNRK